MKKILIVSTVSRQFYLFEQTNIEVLKSLGYEIHGAANFDDANARLDELDIIRHHFDIQRSPFSLKNIKAYKQLKKIMQSENYDKVHCHSPMGGVLARLAAKCSGISPVIYTVHGFHFYKGAPVKNWLIYYPIEKWLSKYTDVLITINKEDYQKAKKSFKAGRIEYIPGVGLDIEKFANVTIDKSKKRKELGLPEDAFVVLSVGELNKNKNHEIVIKALARINNPSIYYIICGQGPLENYLRGVANQVGLDNRIKLLGFRNDVAEIYKTADIFAFPSLREGLSVSLMEAIANGLPCAASRIRGNVDLLEQQYEELFDPMNVTEVANCILKLLNNKYKSESTLKNIEIYSTKNVLRFMKSVYENS